MTSRIATLTVISLLAVFVSTPAHLHGQQPATAQDHAQHHPEAAQQPAAAPAATIGDTKANMMSMMANMMSMIDMMSMMNMMGGGANQREAAPTRPHK